MGIALGIAGTLMQGMTRNPLADPGLLGLHSGAATSVVIGIHVFGIGSILGYASFGFIGAGIAALLVYTIASMGKVGATPIRLALAGAALSTGLSSITSAMLLLNQQVADQFRFWQMGTLGARSKNEVLIIGSIIAISTIPTLVFGGKVLNSLALGEDVASSLGLHVRRVQIYLATIVVLLAGSATALVGPIGFLGLLVPHATRLLVGTDYRRILIFSALIGPLLLISADVLGRIIFPPTEVQASVMTAVIGAPVFIALVRNRKQVEL